VNYSHRSPKGNRHMRHVLNQAANAAARTKGSIFEIVYRRSVPRLGHVHFTPTYASWLNQVEIWFNRITQQSIRRGTFRSVKELVAKIDAFVQNSNASARPFVWTATADSIFATVQRLCERISGQDTSRWPTP